MVEFVPILAFVLGVCALGVQPASFGSIAPKGGEPALIVLRERFGDVVEDPTVYLSGDRFRLFVTIPGTVPVNIDVAVIQESEVHFLYPDVKQITPGNRIPLPGAFQLTGDHPVYICLFLGDSHLSRANMRSLGPLVRQRASLCKTVTAPRSL